MTLSIGLSVNPQDPQWLELAREAERVGVDSIWVPEFWAYDAFTPLAAIAARTKRVRLATGIAQLGARTPAMLAMSAMSLQHISGGRFVLGIGTSGPQVMEGWHGVRFSRPVRRTRETIEIIRRITAGERLTYAGEVYQLPLPGSDGVAIRSRAGACFVPVYVAALGPANLALTGELADGWIGNSFFPELGGGVLRPARGGGAAGRAVALGPGPGGRGERGVHRRHRGGRAAPRRRVRVHVRRDGIAGEQLLQQRLRQAGLRR